MEIELMERLVYCTAHIAALQIENHSASFC